MARYLYRCDSCQAEQERDFTMGEQPAAVDCGCGTSADRVFEPTHHRHVGRNGEPVRAPGSEWIGGDRFSASRFKAENPGAGKRRR